VLQEQLADSFAVSDCARLSEEYEGFEKLGEGSCGVVYKVRSRADSKDVALKVMRMDDEEHLLNARNEYKLLKHITHPKVIRALDFFTYSMGAVMVLDFFDGLKLSKAVRQAPGKRFNESCARQLSVQLVSAVSHLHSCGVIHRDVKADNVLVSRDGTDLRLVDFNAAKQVADSAPLTMTGTVEYMPPEVLRGQSPSEAGDVWAIGLCLCLMLTGQLPSERRALHISFDGMDVAPDMVGSLVRLDGGSWKVVSEPCKEVVRDCLELCCESRPSSSDILARPWFAMNAVEVEPVPAS
jgi:serine/threonine protein kinase